MFMMKEWYFASAAATASPGMRAGSVSRAFRGWVPGTKATIPREGVIGITSYSRTCTCSLQSAIQIALDTVLYVAVYNYSIII